jgi:hypothetical protein
MCRTDRIAQRTGQADQDKQNKTSRTGQAGQDRKDRTGRTRQDRTGKAEQDIYVIYAFLSQFH